ncbi:hypothetical protein N0V88_003083 [Collariella sp. IMI 366227]|nr:hypothetical protein N0V88_003083 [Collariella sp. IMI 366227]
MIGLAVATGTQSQRATKAESNFAALSASVTETGSNRVIDGGCALDPAKVDGTPYTSFSLLSASTFTRYCNKDTPHAPLIALFTADFDTCMDACAAYTQFVSDPSVDTGGLNRFIPSWTNKTAATVAKAPGNCYLKAGPLNKTSLTTPTLVCHSALLAPEA